MASRTETKNETRESRFAANVETLVSALGQTDRVAPARGCCFLLGERRSVEPMAARWSLVVSRLRPSLRITSWRRATGRTMPCLASCGRRFCRPLSVGTDPRFDRRQQSNEGCAPATPVITSTRNNGHLRNRLDDRHRCCPTS